MFLHGMKSRYLQILPVSSSASMSASLAGVLLLFTVSLTCFCYVASYQCSPECNRPRDCPPAPTNCSFGQAKDACGCCLQCAKGEGEQCNGLYFEFGRCAAIEFREQLRHGEALLTTAVGLGIAIPMTAAHALLEGQVKGISERLSDVLEQSLAN